jgi:nitric oxide reductase large subunit
VFEYFGFWPAIVIAVSGLLLGSIRYLVPAFVALRAMKLDRDVEIQSGIKGFSIKTKRRSAGRQRTL